MDTVIRITHWFPIVTFCPVNKRPDFIFVSVIFKNEFRELYSIRKSFKRFWFSTCFMEDIAADLESMYPTAIQITVNLMFNKHIVIKRKKNNA